MSTDPIKKILLTKAQQQQLGHFYILRAPQMITSPDDYLATWMDDFLIQFIAQEKKCDQQLAKSTYEFDVADILKLTKQPERTRFVVEDLKEVFNFVELHPFEFKTKLIIFYQAHFIENTVANKLLKLLEEPTNNTTIFFLYGTRTEIMKTIESRAIKLNLPLLNSSTPPSFSSLAEFLQAASNPSQKLLNSFFQRELSLNELLDKLYRRREQERELITTLTDCFRLYSSNFAHSNRAIELLKMYRQQKSLNSPFKTRLFPLLAHFQQNYV